jgi:hypothetical protein
MRLNAVEAPGAWVRFLVDMLFLLFLLFCKYVGKMLLFLLFCTLGFISSTLKYQDYFWGCILHFFEVYVSRIYLWNK